MPIENNIKNNPETLNGISGENKRVINRLKNLILAHRLNSRQKLISNPTNLGTVITFLPLALGFSQFLLENSRLNKTFGKTDWFFEKNLPVFTHFNTKLNFETFEYIAKSNTRLKLQKNNVCFGQSPFLTTLKKTKFPKNPNLSEMSCDFYFLSSGNDYRKSSSFSQIARSLDTLPAYLEGFRQKKEVKEILKNNNFLFSQSKATKALESKSEQSLKQKKLLEKHLQAQTKKFALNSNFTTKLTLINNVEKQNTLLSTNETFELDPLIKRFSKFYKNRLDFYKTQKLVNKELQTLFAEKNISFLELNSFDKISTKIANSTASIPLKNILLEHTDLNDELLIEAILQELDKNKISENLKINRLMSGYNYPDMSTDDLYWFSLAKLGHEKNLRKLKLEPLLLSSNNSLSVGTTREYDFKLKQIPNLPVTITQVALSNPNSAQIFYKGSAIVLDSERALDWKPRSNEKENLRAWFHNYISPLNSLIQPLENFFGVYSSPKFLSESQNFDSDYFLKKPLFYETWMSNGNLSGPIQTAGPSSSGFSPFLSSFHLPFQNVSSQSSFIKTLEIDLSKIQDTNQFITIPILKIDQPFLKKNGQSSNQLNIESSHPSFNFISKGNPDYNFFRDSSFRKSFLTKKFSGRYFKIGSIFSKTITTTPSNLDNWEPLTSRSWLIITQLSFALFIFQVLKSLAENYGRELLGYLLDLVASLGILDDSLKQEIEILMGQRDKGFRVVLESRKNFKDIVGIQRLLPEIYEVVWFLRNSAREFALSKTLPRGILLTGPPGTGKTLLVQALAGEAQVPVIVLSGSSLIEPGESGALKLELVFQEARQLAPCIVFIDEIDTLAQKRSGVVQNPMGPDELLESLTSFEKTQAGSNFDRKKVSSQTEEGSKVEDSKSDTNSEQDQLSLLTQFLIELDGIQGRDGVIVIGATNRPEVLDPALLRPGRFDKILQVGLPGHQKRIEILQFYGKSLGYETEIPWNYLGDRTAGFTAADLATLMNESTIKAILTQTSHTIETIEHGIDRLTTSENEKYSLFKLKSLNTSSNNSSLTIDSKMSILRLAYYQAGKIVLSSLLENHPKSVMASLWPRRPTIRSAQIATNLQNSIFEFSRLSEITDRLVGCYAGKAAEVLFIQQFSSSKYGQFSTLGLEDLLFAQKLIKCILEKWIFYSKKSYIQEKAFLSPNINLREFREIPEKLDFYNDIVESIELPPMRQALETQTSSLGSKKNTGIDVSSTQIYYSIPWWQQKISTELEFVEKNFTNWSRLYLSNPEQNDRNPEWLPPDEFYHTSSGLKNVKKAFSNLSTKKNQQKSQISKASPSHLKQRYLPSKADFSWNEVAQLTKDYPGHSLVLQSFNKALVLLNDNRELLDRIVIELLSREILRQPEIQILLEDFNFQKKHSNQNNSQLENFGPASSNLASHKTFQILESAWGSKSRKSLPRWIDFTEIGKETT
jgi:ATP-dependent Zn protease